MGERRQLNAVERDALREVANIGAGHAATALSQMTGRTIMINVPEVDLRRLEDVAQHMGPPDTRVAAVLMQVMGDLTGQTAVILPVPAARHLCDILLRRSTGATREFREMEGSSLKETGNILSSAYLTALSDFLGMMLIPSVPTLVVDSAGVVLTSTHLTVPRDRDTVLCVDTAFRVEGAAEPLHGEFILLPDSVSLSAIFDAIRLEAE
jgi:chemotaxis protein CheC